MDLKTIYQRAMQYGVARFGEEPDRIQISEDGLNLVYITSHCGDVDEDYHVISEEDLTSDLDTVYAERKRLEEEERQKQLIERERRERERKKAEKEERRRQYEKLKKEFE